MGRVLFCIYINDLPLQISSSSAEYQMLADDTTLHTTGKSVLQIQKTLQLCLDRISVWCNANCMLNHVKTKVIVITTRQRHHFSDLSLRLSVDGQNIDTVTKHRLLGLTVDKKFRWQVPDRTHAKHVIFIFIFSAATCYKQRYQKNLLQRSHKILHRSCISSVGWLWRSTFKK